jgi:hypothetical protein
MKINYKQLYLDHHGSTLDTVDYKGGYDFIMNQEYTADGHDVFLCGDGRSPVSISEDVYYYAHDLTDVLKNAIQNAQAIYCGEEIYDECYIKDEWEQWCEQEGLIEWNDDEEKYEVVGEDDE